MSPRILVLAVAGALTLLFVGCVNPFGRQESAKAPPFEQKGEIKVPSGEEKTITFPIAFVAAPELELKDDWLNNNIRVIENKPDHFRILNNNFEQVILKWTAKGAR